MNIRYTPVRRLRTQIFHHIFQRKPHIFNEATRKDFICVGTWSFIRRVVLCVVEVKHTLDEREKNTHTLIPFRCTNVLFPFTAYMVAIIVTTFNKPIRLSQCQAQGVTGYNSMQERWVNVIMRHKEVHNSKKTTTWPEKKVNIISSLLK